MAADLKKVKRHIYLIYGLAAAVEVIVAAFNKSWGACDVPPFIILLGVFVLLMVITLFIMAVIAVSHRPYRPLFLHTIIATVSFFVISFVLTWIASLFLIG